MEQGLFVTVTSVFQIVYTVLHLVMCPLLNKGPVDAVLLEETSAGDAGRDGPASSCR